MTSEMAGAMPTMINFTLDFNAARRRLEVLKLRSYSDMRDAIDELRIKINFFKALVDTGIRNDKRLSELDLDRNYEAYFTQVLTIIGEHFPVEDTLMYQSHIENNELWLIPYPQGMNVFGDEEICEGFANPESYFTPFEHQVRVFFALLNIGYDEQEWEACNQYFDWGVPVAPPWSMDTYLNGELFEEKMHAAGYDTIHQCLDIVWGSSNNFFGFYPYSQELQDYPEFSKANLDLFEEEWIEAKDILELEKAAVEMCQKDRSIYQRLAYIWAGCLESRRRERIRV